MRKLASIQKCVNIQPIVGADRIELATFLGWNVIVNKNEFKVGDLAVYVEYDSLLPVSNSNFEFLRSRCYSPKYNAYRIRCMKMRGVFSQGIVFPLSLLCQVDCPRYNNQYVQYKEGEDVTELLGITKYDPEAWAEEHQLQNNGHDSRLKNPIIRWLCQFRWIKQLIFPKQYKKWPEIIQKTDECRIQTIPEVINKFKDTVCYISEKVDGMSASYLYYKNTFLICSRNFINYDKQSSYWKIAQKYNLKYILKNNKDIAIQGEIIGQKVQNGCGRNLYQCTEDDFYVFNMYDLKRNKMLMLEEMEKFCQNNGLKLVPILDRHYILGIDNLSQLLNKAILKSTLNKDEWAEGIVIREKNRINNPYERMGKHLSFKVINKEFLMKKENNNE